MHVLIQLQYQLSQLISRSPVVVQGNNIIPFCQTVLVYQRGPIGFSINSKQGRHYFPSPIREL